MCARRERNNARRAFTLCELIIVVVCIGLLGGMTAGGFRNVMQAGREEAAVGKARLINAARSSYSLMVPGAGQRWNAAASDAERFALLVEAELVEGDAGDYLQSSGGYTLSLTGALRGKTQLLKNGQTQSYR